MKKKLIIVDISSFIFRAFYAIRPLNAPDGTPVNAVYGVLSMMLKLMSEHKPTHLFLARDTKDGSFRKEVYNLYKANRSEPPEELIPQFALIEKLIDRLALQSLTIPRYEADDVIASAVVQWRNYFDEIYIASGDKDLMQFVDDRVKILDTMKDKIFGEQEVKEKMGVRPDQIVDYLSMLGDASDNVPGMKGIGEKGAQKLLEQYDTLENCFKHKHEITNKRVKTAFDEEEANAYLSKKLITLVTDLNLEREPEATKFSFYPSDSLMSFMDELGFKSFKIKLQEFARIEDHNQEEIQKTIERKSTSLIGSEKDFRTFFAELQNVEELYFQAFISINEEDRNIQTLEQIYFSLDKSIYLMKFSDSDLLGSDGVLSPDLQHELLDFMCTSGKQLVTYDIKKFMYYCCLQTLPLPNSYFDLAQASFVLDPERKHTLYDMIKNASINLLCEELPEAVDCFCELKKIQEEKLKEFKLGTVFYEIDNKLISILSEMEFNGILLDSNYYKNLETEFAKELATIEKKIEAVSGEKINLKSPKQVSFLLFEKLQLPVIRKTKTGVSTDSDVLIELVSLNLSEIPALILTYRELEKLYSTYIKLLPTMVSGKTKKIHTNFHQFNAATGRLSSDSPNLQNIPIRTENGRKLRKGFLPSKGNILLSADYSQVELRILAHFSEDPAMLQAFKEGIDIHSQTAAEMFEKPLKDITKDDRSKAKAINFGLMYGQSSFGLSQTLHIEQREAKEFITNYFNKFHRVKTYLDSLKEFCEKTGYAQTLLGRKRFLSDIKSTNRNIKSMAERVAVNSPIQGTAADIIKLSMINIDAEMKTKKLQSKMLLQVHDELIFDVIPGEKNVMEELVRRNMESAVTLKVPLLVEIASGQNWYDLK